MPEEPSLNIGPHCRETSQLCLSNKCLKMTMLIRFRFYRLNLNKKLKLYEDGIDTIEKQRTKIH